MTRMTPKTKLGRLPQLLLLTLLLAVVPAQASNAAAPKLVVGAPLKGITVTGKQQVSASLQVAKKSRVTSASFYVQDQLITTDNVAPFTIAPDATFDTNTLKGGPRKLRFKVVFTETLPGGKTITKTRSHNRSIYVFRPPVAGQTLPSKSWKRIFNDDFSSPAKSQATWLTQRDDWIKKGIPYSNLEGAGYLPSNITFGNGTADIKTSHRPAAGFSQSTGSMNTRNTFTFKYGYIEGRMLVPACSGCWPAFWTLSVLDHWPPEFDIIEFFDTSKQVIPYSAVHWPSPLEKKGDYFSERLQVSDFDHYVGTWHTYGMLWTKRTVQFFIDGNPGPQYSVESKIPSAAMYPIIQLAIGRGFKPPAGQTMQVDHVRAWQRKR